MSSRVSHLGAIEVPVGDYDKPPEAPIFIGETRDVGSTLRVWCEPCRREIYPDLRALGSGARAVQDFTPIVSLEFRRFISRSEQREVLVEIEISAYVGQCRRCLRIYVSRVSEASYNRGMIPKVHSLEEAEDWFLANSSGCVRCVRADGQEKTVDTYPDAKDFFAGGAKEAPGKPGG